MMKHDQHADGDSETPAAPATKLEALLHRWLVEYNPLYLLSAASVCGGLTLVSREVANHDSLGALLAIPVIAELYALCLIGGAALLVRLDRRRPAAMIGLLVMVFQADPMLHVETCSFLGLPGQLASVAWLLLFFVKLFLLCRALELRLSRGSVRVLAFGAIGLASLPWLLQALDPAGRSAVTSLWLFALGTAAAWTTRNVASAVGWDPRGRRCIRGAWGILGALVVAHAAFWTHEYYFDLTPALFAAPLVALRFARREWEVWAGAGVTVLIASLVVTTESGWSVVTAMAAITLTLVAIRARLLRTTTVTAPTPRPPYRSYEPLVSATTTVVHDVSAHARPRLLLGALFAAYLSAWSAGWSHGALPDHSLWLFAALTVACVIVVYRYRRPWLTTALSTVAIPLAAQRGWISVPDTTLEWGAAFVGGGFAMLFASLLASWRLVARAQKTSVTQTG